MQSALTARHEGEHKSPMAELILASRSPYRAALLGRLRLPFVQVDPAVDEAPLQAEIADPEDLTLRLAEQKAGAMAAKHPGTVVIGSDQMAHLDGETLGKPGNAAGARRQLCILAGREHELVTALVVRRDAEVRHHIDVTRLHMRELDAAAIDRYLAGDEPFDCAGSYKLEAGGIALFDRIDSEDHTAIVGLPLIALTCILLDFGFAIP